MNFCKGASYFPYGTISEFNHSGKQLVSFMGFNSVCFMDPDLSSSCEFWLDEAGGIRP